MIFSLHIKGFFYEIIFSAVDDKFRVIPPFLKIFNFFFQCCKKQVKMERLEKLQKSFSCLKAACEKREQFEQCHSRELILYDAAARYLKELKDSGEAITPKAWQREIDQLAAGKQTDTLAMKSMREDLKAVERLRKTAEQLSRQERDKSHDREPER